MTLVVDISLQTFVTWLVMDLLIQLHLHLQQPQKLPPQAMVLLNEHALVVQLVSFTCQMEELHGVLRSLASNIVIHHKHFLYYFEELLAGSPSLKTALQVAMPTVYLLLY